MSVLIAICGETYAILAADSRLTINSLDNKIKIINDDYHKIFKLNDNLIFGSAGQFFYSEPLTVPFYGKDYNNLTLEEADNLIQGYMNEVFNILSPIGIRLYILCGKNKAGEMCLYQYQYNLYTQEKNIYKYNAVKSDVDYSCIGLPPKLSNKLNEYDAKIQDILDKSVNKQDIFDGLIELIEDVSTIDNTVGGNPEIITL